MKWERKRAKPTIPSKRFDEHCFVAVIGGFVCVTVVRNANTFPSRFLFALFLPLLDCYLGIFVVVCCCRESNPTWVDVVVVYRTLVITIQEQRFVLLLCSPSCRVRQFHFEYDVNMMTRCRLYLQGKCVLFHFDCSKWRLDVVCRTFIMFVNQRIRIHFWRCDWTKELRVNKSKWRMKMNGAQEHAKNRWEAQLIVCLVQYKKLAPISLNESFSLDVVRLMQMNKRSKRARHKREKANWKTQKFNLSFFPLFSMEINFPQVESRFVCFKATANFSFCVVLWWTWWINVFFRLTKESNHHFHFWRIFKLDSSFNTIC